MACETASTHALRVSRIFSSFIVTKFSLFQAVSALRRAAFCHLHNNISHSFAYARSLRSLYRSLRYWETARRKSSLSVGVFPRASINDTWLYEIALDPLCKHLLSRIYASFSFSRYCTRYCSIQGDRYRCHRGGYNLSFSRMQVGRSVGRVANGHVRVFTNTRQRDVKRRMIQLLAGCGSNPWPSRESWASHLPARHLLFLPPSLTEGSRQWPFVMALSPRQLDVLYSSMGQKGASCHYNGSFVHLWVTFRNGFPPVRRPREARRHVRRTYIRRSGVVIFHRPLIISGR